MSQIFLLISFCLLTTLTQLQATEEQPQRALEVTCDVGAIVKDVEEFVENTWGLYDEVMSSYQDVIVEAVECVQDYGDFFGLVSCLATALTSWVQTLGPEIEQYNLDLISLGEQFADDVYNCSA